jgi:hypothetical protein
MYSLPRTIPPTDQSLTRSVIHVLGESTCLTMLRILAHCLYSVQRGGRVEIIANDQGHRITPSWVGFTEDERLYVPIFQSCPTLTNKFL